MIKNLCNMNSLNKKSILFSAIILFCLVFYQCKSKIENAASDMKTKTLNLSLAEWSIHRALETGELKAEDFASIAKNDFGIEAVEYVNSFYKDRATDTMFWEMMRSRSDSIGVKNLIIMVDEEGDLGEPDADKRKIAVENHYKWVDAAHILGCHSIRVNAFGNGTKEQVQAAMVDALKQLCTYAEKSNINVLIENHGLYSSDGKWVREIMQKTGMNNVGTLPDFGNWCTSHKWGSTEKGKECDHVYDRYVGVSETLPFAKGVSAKSYAFDDNGEETIIDFGKMLKMVYDSDFSGYIGIEYEGGPLSEREGVLATKKLLERKWQEMNQ